MLTQAQAQIIYGQKLKKLIQKSNRSQSMIADNLNMSKTTMCNLLNGKGKPSLESYFRIIQFINAHPNRIFNITETDMKRFLKSIPNKN